METSTTQLIGHENNRKLIYRLWQNRAVSGSYLFTGMDSIGKKMTALWFARMLNCHDPDPPCGSCRSCRKINSGLHPDVKVIAREKDKTVITIDQVRQEIIDPSNYKPLEGKFRVFIVDDAHLLNEQAQNAMLKTLEEPGSLIIITLVTCRPSELLPTIISRCREIKFFPLSPDVMEKILYTNGISGEKIKLLMSLASGSPGRAIDIFRDESFWKRRGQLFAILHRLPDGRLEDILDFSEKFKISRTDVRSLELVFESLLSWFRDILYLQNRMPGRSLINEDFYENLKHVANCYTCEDIIGIQDLILEIRKLVFENNMNIKMALQRLLIKIKQAGTVKI